MVTLHVPETPATFHMIGEEHPYIFNVGGQEHRVDDLPAESNTGMFGGTLTGGDRSGCR